MFWIEGISRTPSGFALDTLLVNGSRIQQPLHCLASKLTAGRTSRKRITTDCETWSRLPGEPFWEAMGMQAHRPRSGQVVFQIVDQGKRYLIPASVLIAAVMRPIQHMQSFLFKPQGLDTFSSPIVQDGHPSIALHLPQFKVFGQIGRLPRSLIAGYSWMHCFPSARAMWDSVYQAATDGKLDMALPNASMTMTLRSVKSQGYHLVTELVIMSIEAKEPPFAFATGHPTQIACHDSATMDWKAGHRPACTIPARDGIWALSDEEWEQITTTLRPGPRVKFDLRKIIDLILVKFGTGQAWRKLTFGELNFPIVQATYQRMQKNGQWSVLEELLQRARRLTTT